ncbi:MAG: amidohydrolase/deacetylase family metallohydrolase [Herpetosiphonaceae bacterium]|nr:amidohydrolase/deacetylase family metallohydrolase [Herpetosiphonaceae bacterium]
MHFDLLIRNGIVCDPSSGTNGRFDVAVSAGRIAAVEPTIATDTATEVIDAAGQYVTPGLVDLHTHIYHGATYWGIRAAPVAARTGVTTWIDAGSAGAYSMLGFRDFVATPANVNVFALLNISAIGLIAPTWELANLNYCDVDLCCKLAEQNPELVRGIKARIDVNTLGGSGLEPLRRARRVADYCALPLMVHIGVGPPALGEVLTWMRPGDILTHCFTGNSMRIVDDAGKLRPEVQHAREQGIVMDIGHGGGSFSFTTAEAVMSSGFWPDVISSDIHQLSIHGPLYDLPTCMSKFLALGMPFEDVVRATTIRPAAVMGLPDGAGTLRPGARADLALFQIEGGDFTFYDVHMEPHVGHELIHNTLTIAAGQPLPHLPADPPAPWSELSEEQRSLL